MVSEKALKETAAEIRSKSSNDLLIEIERENRLVAQVIREFTLRSVPESRRVIIQNDMATIYQLLKTQDRLDQT